MEEAWTSSSRPFHPVLPGAFVEFSPWFHLSWLVISQWRFSFPLLVSPSQINSVESIVLGLHSFPVICSSFCPSVILPSDRVLNSHLYLELWSHLGTSIHNSQFSKYNGLDSITDSMDMNLSKVPEIAKDREVWGCCTPWGHKDLNSAYWLNNSELKFTCLIQILFFHKLLSLSKASPSHWMSLNFPKCSA